MNTQFNSNVIWLQLEYKISTLIGKFYQGQLTKVLDQDEFIIEKVLKKTKTHYQIKFLGYDEPEWVPKENITNTIKDIQ